MNGSTPKSKRLTILTKLEQKAIFELPELEAKEYDNLFRIDPDFRAEFENFQFLESKLFFVLQLGFFRKSLMLFYFDIAQVKDESEYILKTFLSGFELIDLQPKINKKARLQIEGIILKKFDFCRYTSSHEDLLLSHISGSIQIDSSPKFIFNELANYCIKKRILLPGYTTIQDLVSKGMLTEEGRIFDHINDFVDPELLKKVDQLIERGSTNKYFLSMLKAPDKGFEYQSTMAERDKLEEMQEIYFISKEIIKNLNISNQSVEYFAELVIKYQIIQLQKLDTNRRRFLMLCFVNYRYRISNDNLAKTFIHLIGKYENDVQRMSKEHAVETRLFNQKLLKRTSNILREITSKDLHDDAPVRELRERVFRIFPREEIIWASKLLDKYDSNKEEQKWLLYDKSYPKIRRNIRHIFKVLDLDSNNTWESGGEKTGNLLETAAYLKNHWQNKKLFPISELPIDATTDKTVFRSTKNSLPNAKRIEIETYKSLRKMLRSNNLHLSDSFEFRSLEDDLIDKTSFKSEKKNLLESIELPSLEYDFSQLLKQKLKALDSSICKTNNNIIEGKNPFFTMSHNDKDWFIKYESLPDPNIDNQIFTKYGRMELVELFREMDRKTNFLDCFGHLLSRNAKSIPNQNALIAAIIGYATNLGLNKMAECSPFTYAKLKETSDNFIRHQNLNRASEILIHNTSTHQTLNYYDLGNLIHSSSDGQKFLSAVDTFNAVRSPKYFGMGKGISVISLNANYIPLGMVIVSSNEYEGNYVLELLLMNNTNIQPKIHSTDMHGITDINFALLDLCGYSFAPRITNISSRTASLSSAADPKSFNDNFPLKPTQKIDEKLIFDESKNIQRIILSIMKRSSPVSTIVKKLNYSPKNNRTRKALAEYDKLIRSIHQMKYIDDPEYRRNIQSALNRGEGYHQLTKSIGIANGGKNIAKSIQEQYLFRESNRLIANMIINFNSSILSTFINEKTKANQLDELEAVKRISPVAWSGINMYGQYRFDINYPNTSDSNLRKQLKEESLRPKEVSEN